LAVNRLVEIIKAGRLNHRAAAARLAGFTVLFITTAIEAIEKFADSFGGL
jgi:hypothetical protein